MEEYTLFVESYASSVFGVYGARMKITQVKVRVIKFQHQTDTTGDTATFEYNNGVITHS